MHTVNLMHHEGAAGMTAAVRDPSPVIFAAKILARSPRRLTIPVMINNTYGMRVSQKFKARMHLGVRGRIADGNVDVATASSFQNAKCLQFCCALVGPLHLGRQTCGHHFSVLLFSKLNRCFSDTLIQKIFF